MGLIKGSVLSKWVLGLAAGLLTAGLLMAGCGDSDADAEPLTKAEFVKQANAICFKASEEVGDEVREDKESDLISATAVALQKDVDGIEALGVPSGDEAQIEAILDNVNKAIESIESTPKPGREANDAIVKAENQAKAYGLKSCPID